MTDKEHFKGCVTEVIEILDTKLNELTSISGHLEFRQPIASMECCRKVLNAIITDEPEVIKVGKIIYNEEEKNDS